MDKVACGAGTWANGTGASAVETCEPCGVPAACLSGGECREGHWNDFCLDCVSKTHEFCIKTEELCIKNEELCIKMMNFAAGRPHSLVYR